MKRYLSSFLVVGMLCLSVNVYGLTASDARKMPSADLQVAMRKLPENELIAFCREVFNGKSPELKTRVVVQLKNLLQSMPAAKREALMKKLNEALPMLNFAFTNDEVSVVLGDGADTEPFLNGVESGFIPRGIKVRPVSSGANRTNL